MYISRRLASSAGIIVYSVTSRLAYGVISFAISIIHAHYHISADLTSIIFLLLGIVYARVNTNDYQQSSCCTREASVPH